MLNFMSFRLGLGPAEQQSTLSFKDLPPIRSLFLWNGMTEKKVLSRIIGNIYYLIWSQLSKVHEVFVSEEDVCCSCRCRRHAAWRSFDFFLHHNAYIRILDLFRPPSLSFWAIPDSSGNLGVKNRLVQIFGWFGSSKSILDHPVCFFALWARKRRCVSVMRMRIRMKCDSKGCPSTSSSFKDEANMNLFYYICLLEAR